MELWFNRSADSAIVSFLSSIVAEPRDPAVMIEGKLDEMLGALFGGRVTRSRPDEEGKS